MSFGVSIAFAASQRRVQLVSSVPSRPGTIQAGIAAVVPDLDANADSRFRVAAYRVVSIPAVDTGRAAGTQARRTAHDS
jgi:hypothetical protein